MAERSAAGEMDRMDERMQILSGTLQIGAGLSNSREWRDIFEDLMERVAMRLADLRWPPDDFGQVLQDIAANQHTLGLSDDMRSLFRRVYSRYVANAVGGGGFFHVFVICQLGHSHASTLFFPFPLGTASPTWSSRQ